jgi:hypothetical protein
VKARWISYDEETERYTWYQADLIGNRFLKNYHKCTNLTLNKDGTINTPFVDYIPEMTYGINYSIIDKMREISGLITGLNAKINSLIARAKGKIPVFHSAKFPTGVSQISLLKDINLGLVFLDNVDIDEINEDPRNKKIADILDLTGAISDVQMMRAEVIYWENKLRDMASTPLVQMGTQTQVVGAKVQEQAIEQSTYGMLPLYLGFMLYINQILNVAAQMKKNLISTIEDKEKLRFQVSPRQFKYFEITKKDSLPDIQVYLSQADQVDEQDKANIRALAEREASVPNSWFSTLDAVELMSMSTKTEMRNYLRYKYKCFKEEQKKAAIEQQKFDAQQQAQNNQTQENITQGQVQGTLENTKLKSEGELRKVALEAALEDGKETPTK